jgi:hypothetical protein
VNGDVSYRGTRAVERELLEFLPRWLGVLHFHVALELLRGLDILLLGFFLLYVWVLEEELVIIVGR